MSGWMPAGRREKRLERAIRTPECWPPPVLWSAAIRAKSPTFSVRTTRPLATAAPKTLCVGAATELELDDGDGVDPDLPKAVDQRLWVRLIDEELHRASAAVLSLW